MAATRFALSGTLVNAPGAGVSFTPVTPAGSPALGATDSQGERVAGPVSVVADHQTGEFTARLQSNAGRDWLWRMAVRLPGQARDLWRANLLPMPYAPATLDDVLPPAAHTSLRGAKWTDLGDTPASTTGHVGEFVRVAPDGALEFAIATPGTGIAGIRVQKDGAARGTAQTMDFIGPITASVVAGVATLTLTGVRDGEVTYAKVAADLKAIIDGAARYDATEVRGARSFALKTLNGDDSQVDLPPVGSGDLANGAVGTDQIANGAITAPKLHAGAVQQSQADWTETDTHDPSYIRNKPAIQVPGDTTPRDAGPGLDLDGNALEVDPGDGLEIAGDKVEPKLADGTLTKSAAGMAVGRVPYGRVDGTPTIPDPAAPWARDGAAASGRAPYSALPADVAKTGEVPDAAAIQRDAGALFTGNTETDIVSTYDSDDAKVDLEVLRGARQLFASTSQIAFGNAQYRLTPDPDYLRGVSPTTPLRLSGGGNTDVYDFTYGDLLALPIVAPAAQLSANNCIVWDGSDRQVLLCRATDGKWRVGSDTVGALPTLTLAVTGSALEDFARRTSTRRVPPAKLGSGARAGETTRFLREDGQFAAPPAAPSNGGDPQPGAAYTDEDAQDAAAAMMTAGNSETTPDVEFQYDDSADTLTGSLKAGSVRPAKLRVTAGGVANRVVTFNADFTGFIGVDPADLGGAAGSRLTPLDAIPTGVDDADVGDLALVKLAHDKRAFLYELVSGGEARNVVSGTAAAQSTPSGGYIGGTYLRWSTASSGSDPVVAYVPDGVAVQGGSLFVKFHSGSFYADAALTRDASRDRVENGVQLRAYANGTDRFSEAPANAAGAAYAAQYFGQDGSTPVNVHSTTNRWELYGRNDTSDAVAQADAAIAREFASAGADDADKVWKLGSDGLNPSWRPDATGGGEEIESGNTFPGDPEIGDRFRLLTAVTTPDNVGLTLGQGSGSNIGWFINSYGSIDRDFNDIQSVSFNTTTGVYTVIRSAADARIPASLIIGSQTIALTAQAGTSVHVYQTAASQSSPGAVGDKLAANVVYTDNTKARPDTEKPIELYDWDGIRWIFDSGSVTALRQRITSDATPWMPASQITGLGAAAGTRRLHAGSATGISVSNSNTDRFNTLELFTRSEADNTYDLDLTDQPRGEIEVSATLHMTSTTPPTFGSDNRSVVRFSTIFFASELHATGVYAANNPGGEVIGSTVIYSGSTALGTLTLRVERDGQDRVGYRLTYVGSGSLSQTFTVQMSLNAVWAPTDAALSDDGEVLNLAKATRVATDQGRSLGVSTTDRNDMVLGIGILEVTQAAYDAIAVKNPNIYYVING